MGKFIKLTGKQRAADIYLDGSRVRAVEAASFGSNVVCDHGIQLEVTETPEQILALIEGGG